MSYPTDPELNTPLSFLDIFANATIEGDLLDRLDACHGDPESLSAEMRDPNVMVLWKALDTARYDDFGVTDDPFDDKYNKAFINMLKINIVLFKQIPWWRSRMGWFMWHCACYANPDAYYPLVWEDHFDPREWYHAGEKPRIVGGKNREVVKEFILD